MQITHGGLKVRHPQMTEQADGRVPQRGHDTRSVPPAHWGTVFIIDHITHPVETGFNAPMPANKGSDRCRIGLIRGEIGDTQCDFVARVAPMPIGDRTIDAKGLPEMRPVYVFIQDRCDPHHASVTPMALCRLCPNVGIRRPSAARDGDRESSR
jgi:hypothetical protein